MIPSESDLSAAGLRVHLDGAVATVRLDRPERRNAQTPLMWRTLAAVGDALPTEVEIVVVRGEGASFSAGLDRSMLGPAGGDGAETVGGLLSENDETMLATIADYQAGFTWLHDPRFVSIAAVQGHAVGAGFQLALACDLRVLTEDASLCMKESALGLVPDLGGTKPLVEAVGYARALEMCATARTVGAAEALRLGLAQQVVGAAELEDAVATLVAALRAPRPGVVAATKSLLHGAGERDLAAQCRREREAQVSRLRALSAAVSGVEE